ncbi:Protein of unknown function [Pyronema omphalodes CBS 100304]|uniref:Uncharacterized protein n=1 Tax=Pyronema omphalodes (strain CBS 100304) TaxID=1076935 RepID=U4L7E5_PYROM|nr:Protein of unknown function [Pyronema omphalodes CBS 100304]
MTTITDATNIAASTTDAKTTSTNNVASQGVNNTPTVLTSVPTAAGPPTSAPVTSATIPTIRLPTYRAIPDGWTKRRMLNVCNFTLGLTFMQHNQVRRQYAIDTAKELWWPLARSPWIGEILDNHLRKLHAEDVRDEAQGGAGCCCY